MSAPVVEPSACTWCGIARRGHAQQFADAVGWHKWAAPTDAQIKARMKARRLVLTVAREGALPVPVGPEPQPSPVDADRAKAPWGRGEDGRPLLPMGAHWTDIPELVDRTVAGIKSRVDQAQSGHWYVAPSTETWRAPGTVCTRVDGYHRTVGQCTNMLPADLELILHAHDDLSWCLDMIGKLRTRVAELEAQAAVVAEFVADRADYIVAIRNCHPDNDHDYDRWQGHAESRRQLAQKLGLPVAWPPKDAAAAADGLTRFFAPTQALREEAAEECELIVFRAEYEEGGMPLGTYDNLAAAREHCEVVLRRDLPFAEPRWLVDDEDEGAGHELLAVVEGEEQYTGYVVTPLEVASKYDPEADE